VTPDRAAYLSGLIGRPWTAQGQGPEAYSCYGLARELQAVLWGRTLPDIPVPPAPSWRWMVEAIRSHPARSAWAEVPACCGVVQAGDGALVLMARLSRPAHIGVWLADSGTVIHADQDLGVTHEGLAHLRARGWGRLMFHEPLTRTGSEI